MLCQRRGLIPLLLYYSRTVIDTPVAQYENTNSPDRSLGEDARPCCAPIVSSSLIAPMLGRRAKLGHKATTIRLSWMSATMTGNGSYAEHTLCPHCQRARFAEEHATSPVSVVRYDYESGGTQRRVLAHTDTLRGLETAAIRGLIDVPRVLAQLQVTPFYASQRLYEEVLAHDAARKTQPQADTDNPNAWPSFYAPRHTVACLNAVSLRLRYNS